jgi:hypothetical protein
MRRMSNSVSLCSIQSFLSILNKVFFLQNIEENFIEFLTKIPKNRVADPDLEWIGIQSGQWIGIRNPDPDLGGQK